MKRHRIIPVLLLTMAATIVSAQLSTEIKVGVLNSNTSSTIDKTIGVDPLTSLSAGIEFSYKLDKHLGIVSGLNYNKHGFAISQGTAFGVLGMDIPIGVKASTEINYLIVPALLEFNVPITRKIEPFISIGPSIAYATSGNVRTAATAILDFNITNTELALSSPDYNRTQLWGNVRGGARIPYNATGHWIIDASYIHSFTDLVSDNFTLDAGGRHRAWNLSIGYGLRF